MLYFFGAYKPPEVIPDPRGGVSPPYSLKDFFTALTTPNWGAEYANYIGIPLIVLFFLAIIFGLKANRVILFTSLFFILLTLRFDGFSLFHIIRNFPVLSSQRIPPRFFVMALFGLGFLSALFFTYIQEKIKNSRTGSILIQIFLIIFTFYVYWDLNRACSLWGKGCIPLEFPDAPVYFSSNPILLSEGKIVQKLSLPNHRNWKLKLKEDSAAVFEWLDWKSYRKIIKFRIYRNGRFENIDSKSYNGILSIFIPKDASLLEMRYSSPYFKVGALISVFSFLLINFFSLNKINKIIFNFLEISFKRQ